MTKLLSILLLLIKIFQPVSDLYGDLCDPDEEIFLLCYKAMSWSFTDVAEMPRLLRRKFVDRLLKQYEAEEKALESR